MSLFRNSPCTLRIHLIFQQQELFVKMSDGILHRSPMLAAKCKCSCDPYCSNGIQPVRILNDFALWRLRMFSAVLSERNRINGLTYSFNSFRGCPLLCQKRPNICVILSMKDLIIICVMKQGSKCNDFSVTFFFTFSAISMALP